MSYYLFLGGVATIYLAQDIIQKIDENAKRKQNLNFLYQDYCKCLEYKGFMNIPDKIEYGHILQNKDIRELESCKREYIHFMSAYYAYKNKSF
jgi:hypothetical protein